MPKEEFPVALHRTDKHIADRWTDIERLMKMSESKPVKLADETLTKEMAFLTGWRLEGQNDGRVLTRDFKFASFVAAMQFVNRLAEASERAGHHPDIDIRYNRVRLVLVTHDAGGITQKDVALAHAANALLPPFYGKTDSSDII
jgi:4a-hydroxytetrahydrobiopterin dehydratase